jgi:molecular chaperone DnaK
MAGMITSLSDDLSSLVSPQLHVVSLRSKSLLTSMLQEFSMLLRKDKGTGKEQKITVQGSTGMSDDEVEKLVKEAEANREADKKKKESIEARNHADSLVYQSEKTLEETKDKYDEKDGETAKSALERLKQVLADRTLRKTISNQQPRLSLMSWWRSDKRSTLTQEILRNLRKEKSEEKKNDDGSVEAEVEEK